MRFVMIPVPSEHVREVIDIVLFSSPDTDKVPNREKARTRVQVQLCDAAARSLLRIVAEATMDGTDLTVAEAATALGEPVENVLGIVRDLDSRALHRDQKLVVLRGPDGRRAKRTADARLIMDPRRAEMVLDALQVVDPQAQ